MTNKHKKKCAQLVVRKIHFKISRGYLYTTVRMALIKKLIIPDVSKEVKQMEFSYILAANIKRYNYYKESSNNLL